MQAGVEKNVVMPKKNSRYSRTVRKTHWKSDSKQRNFNLTKGNNIYIGAGNARRWIILKKKFDYRSDIDFVSYLLDLAEPHTKNIDSPVPSDNNKTEGNELLFEHFEEDSNDSTSSIQHDTPWSQTENISELPLRRSPRTQMSPVKSHIRRSARNITSSIITLPEVQSTNKEEEKKKEGQDVKNMRLKDTDNFKGPIAEESFDIPTNTELEKGNDLVISEEQNISLENVSSFVDERGEATPDMRDIESADVLPEHEQGVTDIAPGLTAEDIPASVHIQETTDDAAPLSSSSANVETVSVITSPVTIPGSEEAKLELNELKQKQKRKRKNDLSQFDFPDDESDEGLAKIERERFHTSRRKRKKHRHGNHNSKRKHRANRKKWSDRKLLTQQSVPEENISCQSVDNDPAEALPPDIDISSETHCEDKHLQRVAIKIKLCCDCNTRHIQDLCPLQNPLFTVEDSVTLDEWNGKTSSLEPQNSEDPCININFSSSDNLKTSEIHPLQENNNTIHFVKANLNSIDNINFQSVSSKDAAPHSSDTDSEICQLNGFHVNVKKEELYPETDGILEDGMREADDIVKDNWAPSGSKHKGDKEQEKAELTYAEASLPSILELKACDSDQGFSVVTTCHIQKYTQFGPLIGQAIKEMDIPDDFSMINIWEVFTGHDRRYISTFDPNSSNWLRYIQPAPSLGLRNLVPMIREKKLYFVTLVELSPGEELLYWFEDPTTVWSKKKMEKTNCGGCNLKFSHPLYYRMHCTVFHDPNFSLTIRKYHCKVCGTAVLGKENIMKHAAEMHEGKGAYQCQYCKKFFLRLNYLEMHRTYGCASNPQRTRPLCDFCGRKFCQPQKLKVHIKRMHSDMADVLREFQCKICFKLLGSRAALQRHMKEVHHKDIIGACTCDRCGKMFQNKSNLKIHMLTHSGVKPFKCQQKTCSAAFTTKQCLQFHYKKVHSFTEQTMPKIERSVAYTFDAYSGGIVEDPGRGKSPKFSNDRRSSTDNNSSSLTSHDDSSSTSSLKADISGTSSTTDGNAGVEERLINDEPPSLTAPSPPCASEIPDQQPPTLEAYGTHTLYSPVYSKVVVSKGSKKWLGHTCLNNLVERGKTITQDVYEFDEKEDENLMDFVNNVGIVETARRKTPAIVFQRPQSSSASLLVEAALDAAERDIELSGSCCIVSPHMDSTTVISSNIADVSATPPLYTVGNIDSNRLVEVHMLSVTSPNHHSVMSPRTCQTAEYTLQNAEELISPATSPSSLSDQQHTSPKIPSERLQHLDDYAVSKGNIESAQNTSLSTSNNLHHTQMVESYSLPNQEDIISPAGTPNPTPAHSHLTNGYSLQQHEEIMSPVGTPDNHHTHVDSYSLNSQDELVSPSETPVTRYDIHRQHQVPTDNLSSDEGDGVVVAQNLSMSLKGKTTHLDLAAATVAYKQYEVLETIQEFGRPDRFEPMIVGTTPELQGLNMSARSGYHHGFVSGNSRYHHGTVVYDMSTERDTVDLSMAGRGTYIGSSSPASYQHADVLRVVSLDLTPGVDLTLSRSHHGHHHHHQLSTSRTVSPLTAASTHVVPEVPRATGLSSPVPTTNGQNLIDASRIMSPSPHPGYQNYPLSPSTYHRSSHVASVSPSSYHHYSGYY